MYRFDDSIAGVTDPTEARGLRLVRDPADDGGPAIYPIDRYRRQSPTMDASRTTFATFPPSRATVYLFRPE